MQDNSEIMHSIMQSWTNDIELILDRIRLNCVELSKYYKQEYHKYKGYLKYFRIPTIVLSAVSSIVSVGLKPYLTQNTISISVCLMGLVVGIINSLELFLTIQTIMEKSLTTSKDFYLLSIEVFKILALERSHRFDKGRDTLIEIYNNYRKLIESAELMNKKINDKLLPVNPFKILNIERYPKDKVKNSTIKRMNPFSKSKPPEPPKKPDDDSKLSMQSLHTYAPSVSQFSLGDGTPTVSKEESDTESPSASASNEEKV